MPTQPAAACQAAELVRWYAPVTANRTAATPMTAAGASLLLTAATAGTSMATPAMTRRTPRPPLTVPGGEVSVVSPTTAQVPASTPIPVAATGSRARKPATAAVSCSGAVAATAVSAATRPCSGGTQPSCTAAKTVVARARARKPSGSGVAIGRRTTRVADGAACSGRDISSPGSGSRTP